MANRRSTPPKSASSIEIVIAEMVLWRVFGCSNDYADRLRPYWSTEHFRGSRRDDRLMLSLGDVPEDLLITLRQWRAQGNGLLDQIVGRSSAEERLRRYQEDLGTVELPEFEQPYPCWLSIRLARPVRVRARIGVTIDWIDDLETSTQLLAEFDREGGHYLDGVVAGLHSLPPELNLGLVRYGDRRGFLVAPGRAALREPRFEMTVADWGVTVGTPWAAAPTQQLEALVTRLPRGTQVDRLTAVPARWLTTALTETDALRRFIFAFAGLETLATLGEKATRARLVARVTDADPTLPVKELLWPGRSDDFTDRNLIFRFSAMAAVYSPATTEADVLAFARIAKARNDLFHGSENSVDRNLSVECQNLLRRYLGLVAGEA